MEWLAIIVAAILLTFTHMEGRKAGEKAQRKKTSTVAQDFEEKLANAEMEAENNKPLADRLAALRERIRLRRGGLG